MICSKIQAFINITTWKQNIELRVNVLEASQKQL